MVFFAVCAHTASYLRPLLALLLTLLLSGCMTLPSPRPLETGEHQVGLTLGGPAVQIGGTPIPLPMANLEGRSGLPRLLDRPLDVNYGLNTTALAFGIVQGHLGASYLLVQEEGFRPALTLTNRLFLATNFPVASQRAPDSGGVWAADQIELTASYLLGNHLLYAGLGQYFDFTSPRLLLTPSLGILLAPGQAQRWRFSAEARYFAVNQINAFDAVRWAPEARGALGVGLGLSYTF